MERTILHIDLNNFFASVECKYNPELLVGYMAVIGSVEDRHGIVLAKNQAAKKRGVKTGMPIREAEKLCPGITFVEANHERYSYWSKKAKALYREYSEKIESFGIDEAWVDVTDNDKDGKTIADEIRERVKEELGLTVSIGVSFNKIFAKLGSDMKKPDGTTVITRDNFKRLVWKLPAQELLFVGKSTLEKLNRVGVSTIGDLAVSDFRYISKYLGKIGENLWFYANGQDDSPVKALDDDDEIKSVGNSVTCYRDLTTHEDVEIMISSLCESVSARLMKYDVGKARSISVGVRDSDLKWVAKQTRLDKPSALSDDFYLSAIELFKEVSDLSVPVRSISVAVFDFTSDDQSSFSDGDKRYDKRLTLMKTVGKIREKYGADAVRRGLSFKDEKLTKEGEGHGGSLPLARK